MLEKGADVRQPHGVRHFVADLLIHADGGDRNDGHVDEEADKDREGRFPAAVLHGLVQGRGMTPIDFSFLDRRRVQVQVVWHNDGAHNSCDREDIGRCGINKSIDLIRITTKTIAA